MFGSLQVSSVYRTAVFFHTGIGPSLTLPVLCAAAAVTMPTDNANRHASNTAATTVCLVAVQWSRSRPHLVSFFAVRTLTRPT